MKYLDIINTQAFKDMLELPEIGNDRIVKFSDNSIHILRDIKDDKPIIQAYFWNYPKIKELLDLIIPSIFFHKPLRWVTYSNTFSTMGWRYHNTNLTTARNGVATSDGNVNWGNITNGGFCYDFDGTNYGIDRFWMHYDTSSIGSGATIQSAFQRFHGTSTSSANTNSDTVEVVASSVVSNTTLASTDWGNLGTTSYGSISFASYNTAGDNDITINSTGLAAISKTGTTKFAARTLNDINATTPTGRNSKTFDSHLLSVTYTISSGTRQQTLSLLGVG